MTHLLRKRRSSAGSNIIGPVSLAKVSSRVRITRLSLFQRNSVVSNVPRRQPWLCRFVFGLRKWP